MSTRQILYRYWAQWGNCCRYQPFDHIRQYFGEKITLYFAWLGFYTAWLIPAAIMGVLVFAYGAVALYEDVPVEELCSSKDAYIMCPHCEDCDLWILSTSCPMVKLNQLTDHTGVVFYSVFISFWVMLLLKFWKRTNASLTYRWSCTEYKKSEELLLPDYVRRATTKKKNPITGVSEPHIPAQTRFLNILSSSAIIITMLCVAVIFVVSVILYRCIISMVIYTSSSDQLSSQAPLIANITGTVIYLVLLMFMEQLYTSLGFHLTRWGAWKRQTIRRFLGYPGHYGTMFGIRVEECSPGGCLMELTQGLLIIMIGRMIFNNSFEVIYPKLVSFSNRKRMGLNSNSKQMEEKPWEKDHKLAPFTGLIYEYLELVLQFGFITIFVAAFPLAPLLALLNNWIEIRLDAQKLLCNHQRPIGDRVQDIGICFHIMEWLAKVTAISNACLLALTSEFLPRRLYMFLYDRTLQGYVNFTLAYAPEEYLQQNHRPCRYQSFRDQKGDFTLFYWYLLAMRLAFIILFEHTILFLQQLIDCAIADIPDSVKLKRQKEQYMAKTTMRDPPEHLHNVLQEMFPRNSWSREYGNA
nr:PREDICTED: anoctamin-7-like [Latimeria chalumnae]|eukprot:XP_014346126.1 PREDICTED: anoctamin-7-like [Latimeria chalumnae]